jgi:hypothetical protein
MDTVSFKLCRRMRKIKACEYLKIVGSHGYIFEFLHITNYFTPLSTSSSYRGILF